MRTSLVAIAILVASLPAAAQQGVTIIIAGRVTDAVSGASVAGASVATGGSCDPPSTALMAAGNVSSRYGGDQAQRIRRGRAKSRARIPRWSSH
jgi:hypothetical protein